VDTGKIVHKPQVLWYSLKTKFMHP